MARGVTPLAVARARPLARASTRARSSRAARASREEGAARASRLCLRARAAPAPGAQAARRATGSRLRRPDRLSSRRTRRTIRPRARELRHAGRWRRALCSARAGRGPTFPCPSRALHPRAFARGRWPVMAYYRPRHFHFPAARARPGAPRTPPGRFRALHITRALCAGGARRSAHQLARAGAWRWSSLGVGGFDER